jgi:L-threonylcarbamoyladenylate synthase
MKASNTQDIVNNLEDNPLTHWNGGRLVVIPTETVYGLAADAANDLAIAKIYALKRRPKFNPLIAHMANSAMAKKYVIWNDWAQILSQHFWPGALTMVLRLKPNAAISALATNGGDTLAVRVPAHNIARDLIQQFGRPLVAPSANISGHVSPTMLAHVREEFPDNPPLMIDGGSCEIGLESSVIDLSADAPILLRAGMVSADAISQALQMPVLRAGDVDAKEIRSPGQLRKHYAPNKPVRLDVTALEEGEALLAFGAPLEGAAHLFNLSQKADLIEAASRLFQGLRALDKTNATTIAVMPIPCAHIGEAINDRLKRASIR